MKWHKIGLFQPKKDQCDTCLAYKCDNCSQEEFLKHQKRKADSRKEKEKDKIDAQTSETKLVFTMDLQAVQLCPLTKANAMYYKTKLKVHNFTIYNLASNKVRLYVWSEDSGGVDSDVFASIIEDFILYQKQVSSEELILYYGVTAVGTKIGMQRCPTYFCRLQ